MSLVQRKIYQPQEDHLLTAECIERILGPFVPAGALDLLVVCLQGQSLECRISNRRSSKTGDFRPHFKNLPPRITLNRDLNPYAFLITLIHEIAHFYVYLDTRKRNAFRIRKYRPKPHGTEWKFRFIRLMEPTVQIHIFPPEIETILISYIQSPKVSFHLDSKLQPLLQKYDTEKGLIRVSDLPVNTRFRVSSGRIFIKLGKVRKRYRCICTKTNKHYLITPGAFVVPLESPAEENFVIGRENNYVCI